MRPGAGYDVKWALLGGHCSARQQGSRHTERVTDLATPLNTMNNVKKAILAPLLVGEKRWRCGAALHVLI